MSTLEKEHVIEESSIILSADYAAITGLSECYLSDISAHSRDIRGERISTYNYPSMWDPICNYSSS